MYEQTTIISKQPKISYEHTRCEIKTRSILLGKRNRLWFKMEESTVYDAYEEEELVIAIMETEMRAAMERAR